MSKLFDIIDPMIERVEPMLPPFVVEFGARLDDEERRKFHTRRAYLRAVGQRASESGKSALIGASDGRLETHPLDEQSALDIRAQLTENDTRTLVLLGLSTVLPRGTTEWYCLDCLSEYPSDYDPVRCRCGGGLFRPSPSAPRMRVRVRRPE